MIYCICEDTEEVTVHSRFLVPLTCKTEEVTVHSRFLVPVTCKTNVSIEVIHWYDEWRWKEKKLAVVVARCQFFISQITIDLMNGRVVHAQRWPTKVTFRVPWFCWGVINVFLLLIGFHTLCTRYTQSVRTSFGSFITFSSRVVVVLLRPYVMYFFFLSLQRWMVGRLGGDFGSQDGRGRDSLRASFPATPVPVAGRYPACERRAEQEALITACRFTCWC